jgi:hypothetical protein
MRLSKEEIAILKLKGRTKYDIKRLKKLKPLDLRPQNILPRSNRTSNPINLWANNKSIYS